MEEKNHIYPIFDRMMTREDKEELLGQHSVMIWFTGLSGSGKSTIAIALERELHKRGLLCRILDGDNIRSGIPARDYRVVELCGVGKRTLAVIFVIPLISEV